MQHEEPPPEVKVPSENAGSPVTSTTSSRQSAIVVVGLVWATVCPRLAATVANSVQQTTAAVQANMVASDTNNFNAILS